LAATSKTNITKPSDNTKNLDNKTTNICQTKPNKTKAWFRSSFMPSSLEITHAYIPQLLQHTQGN